MQNPQGTAEAGTGHDAPWRLAVIGDEAGGESPRLLVGLAQSGNVRARLEAWNPEHSGAILADAAIVEAITEPEAAVRTMRILVDRQPDLLVVGIFPLYDARHAVEVSIATGGRVRPLFWDGTPDARFVAEVLSALEGMRSVRAEAQGAQLRPLLLEALSLSPVALCLTTPEDVLVEVNDAFVDLIGRPAEAMMGHKLAEILPRHRNDAPAVVLEQLDPTGSLIGQACLKAWSAFVPRSGGLHDSDPADPHSGAPLHAATDPVTGLMSRQAFLAQLEHRLLDRVPGDGFALLCLDLDRFKDVNDSLGHQVGDQVLKVVADRLRRRVRALDVVARLAGNEFAILLTEAPEHGELHVVAQRLVRAIGQRIIVGANEIHTGCSVGMALFPQDAADATELVRRAELALREAKRTGRSAECSFSEPLEERIQSRRKTETDLYKGIERGEFMLHYQPIVELPSRRVMGVEALVRWNHPERGLIQPADFIPLAEASGSIRALGAWVLHEACRTVASWRTMGFPRLWLAVNISAAQFRSGDLVNLVDFALTNSGLTASELELEITETAVLEAGQLDTRNQLAQLNALGVTISVDDFGTGYGSLVYLRNFPITKIKIDGSFVMAAPDHPKEAAIVRAIASLGRDLHMRVLAECVETEEQFSLVQQAGCTEAQGFLFSPALPEADLRALLEGLASKSEQGALEAGWVFPEPPPPLSGSASD